MFGHIREIRQVGCKALLLVACFALIIWTVAPPQSHVPKIIDTLQEHAQMIEDHGHSHGLEEDLIWAMHGHSHDAADHDHTQAAFVHSRFMLGPLQPHATKSSVEAARWSSPLYRLERPPRV